MDLNRSQPDDDDFNDLLGGDNREISTESRNPPPLAGASDFSGAIPPEVKEGALAQILGITGNRIRVLANDGGVVRSRRGFYDTRASIKAYTARLRESASRAGKQSSDSDDLKAEKLRLTKAQADGQEQKNAQLRGEVVPIDDVRREWVTVAMDLRAQILAIPARVSGRMGMSREATVQLEEEIRAALEELSDER